jgi:hypothetical protein
VLRLLEVLEVVVDLLAALGVGFPGRVLVRVLCGLCYDGLQENLGVSVSYWNSGSR